MTDDTELTNDDRIDELTAEIDDLESRLDYLADLTVDRIDPPDHVDEQVLRGSLKVDRRKVRTKLDTKRRQLEAAREATNR
ncbi:uncharacterized protein NP_2350A [Natronomonas pharaonis DSM 2160]|uniref:Uncharacterized protein n=1 Tax=Natronomonas pharaonis (strain ATCC 35678 / DSM 2160 / CIP 103997 / JCM 8858 / NBRC 14720 / NCIMB 2260 / Gabara) TaxID=348780 RepID=A0A1U7EW22_NATPD|nr:hypothetical protein [Natronomonas pharaonis]CAI49266.1 uncharacterized protein NP_2350A [Natronomonas pharaonis DSM 2160]